MVGADNKPSQSVAEQVISGTPVAVTEQVSGLPAFQYVRKIEPPAASPSLPASKRKYAAKPLLVRVRGGWGGYDLTAVIALETERGNDLLLPGVQLRQHGSRQRLLAALWCRIEHGYLLNIRELFHHFHNAEREA